MDFKSLGLKEEIVDAITELGFDTPTPIQIEAIPTLLTGVTDLIGLAQTGTGKTAAFGLPAIHLVEPDEKKIQVIVLSPTRELASQIADDLRRFGKNIKGLKIATVYGGASIETQIREIKRGVQIVVATPGRLCDLINRKRIDISNVSYAILDEADEMLNMGFKDDLDFILSHTPKEKFTWLFSATMPNEVRRIAKTYMTDPLEVTVGKVNSSNENIEHKYYLVHDRDRYAGLKRVLDFYPDIFGLIFCRTRNETRDVAEKLMADGYSAEPIHGDLSQQQRDGVMKKFKNKSIQILVATDVAARGIDVDNITHVINYNIPDDIESYTHRSGRTGRAGNKGISIAILSPRDKRKIFLIEKQINQKFKKDLLPSGEEICEKQLFHLVNKVKNTEVSEGQMTDYLPQINELFADMTKEDLVAKLVSTEFNRFANYYKNARDINMQDKGGDRDSGTERRGRDNETHDRLHINLGELDGFDKGGLLRFVCDTTDVTSAILGRIDLKRSFSFVDVEKANTDAVLAGLNSASFEGRDVKVERSKSTGGSGGGGQRRSGGSGAGSRRAFGGDRPRGNSGSGGGDRKRSYGGGDRDRGDSRNSGGSRDSSGGSRRRSSDAGGSRRRAEH